MKRFKSFAKEHEATVHDIFENDDQFNEDFGFKTILSEKSATAPLNPQIWGDIKKASPEEAESLYIKAMKFIVKAKTKYTRLMMSVTKKIQNSQFLVDIKKMDAFVDKILNRGKKASGITDLLRGAIIAPDNDSLETAVKLVKKNFVVTRFEHKGKGDDKEYGYFGSYHFLVNVEGVNAEIQVMTRKLWNYKHQAHKVYTKYRSGGEYDDKIKKLDTQMSKELFSRGNAGGKKRK